MCALDDLGAGSLDSGKGQFVSSLIAFLCDSTREHFLEKSVDNGIDHPCGLP